MKRSLLSLFLLVGLGVPMAMAKPLSSYAIRPLLVAEPLRDADQATYPFTVVYESDDPIDVTTIGDRDAFVSAPNHLSWRREAGQEGLFATLIAFEVNETNTRVAAHYEFPRPEDGWAAWKLRQLEVTLPGGAIKTTTGDASVRWSLGLDGIVLDLPELADLQLPFIHTVPQVGPDDAFLDFEVHYVANYPLDPDLFGDDEMSVFGTSLSTLEIEGEEVSVGLPEGPRFPVVAIDVLASANNQEMTVTYRVQRPETGWSKSGLNLWILAEPFKLDANARGWYTIGSPWLNYIHARQPGEVQSRLEIPRYTHPEQSSQVFSVTYQHPAGILLDSLGDDDLSLVPPSSYFFSALQKFDIADVSPELVSVEANDDQTEVVATYELVRPDEGWQTLGGSVSFSLSTAAGAVQTLDGYETADAYLGISIIDAGDPAAAQTVGFDAWVSDLGRSLGLEERPTPTSDADKDGTPDIVEFMLGTDPLDATEVHGLSPEIVEVDEVAHLQLTLDQAVNAGAGVILEGSADGKAWEEAQRYFDLVEVDRDRKAVEKLTMRSSKSLAELPYHYFRVQVFPIR